MIGLKIQVLCTARPSDWKSSLGASLKTILIWESTRANTELYASLLKHDISHQVILLETNSWDLLWIWIQRVESCKSFESLEYLAFYNQAWSLCDDFKCQEIKSVLLLKLISPAARSMSSEWTSSEVACQQIRWVFFFYLAYIKGWPTDMTRYEDNCTVLISLTIALWHEYHFYREGIYSKWILVILQHTYTEQINTLQYNLTSIYCLKFIVWTEKGEEWNYGKLGK